MRAKIISSLEKCFLDENVLSKPALTDFSLLKNENNPMIIYYLILNNTCWQHHTMHQSITFHRAKVIFFSHFYQHRLEKYWRSAMLVTQKNLAHIQKELPEDKGLTSRGPMSVLPRRNYALICLLESDVRRCPSQREAFVLISLLPPPVIGACAQSFPLVVLHGIRQWNRPRLQLCGKALRVQRDCA